MDSPSVLPRPDVVAAPTAPRPTPVPAQAKFSQVLAASARGIVSGADQAVTALPGGPLMAVALRGGASVAIPAGAGAGVTGPSLPMGFAPSVAMQVPQVPAGGGTANRVNVTPEGPVASGSDPAGGVASVAGGTGVEGALAQSQEMNLYFLQIQEQVNAQDRAYTAYSNVLKAEHDTVMTAVGNIR